MVDDFKEHIWLGLEYVCSENDDLWNMTEQDVIKFASDELEKIGVIKKENIIDSFTTRVKILFCVREFCAKQKSESAAY